MCLPVPIVQQLFIDARQKAILEEDNKMLRTDIESYASAVEEYELALTAADSLENTQIKIISAQETKLEIKDSIIKDAKKQVKTWQFAAGGLFIALIISLF